MPKQYAGEVVRPAAVAAAIVAIRADHAVRGAARDGAEWAAINRGAGFPSATGDAPLRLNGTELTVALIEAELLTTDEAAALLGATRQHVAALCKRGILPGLRRGRDWWVPRSAALAYRDAEKDKGGRPRRDGRRP
jgi:excisionase family DNA binding protein